MHARLSLLIGPPPVTWSESCPLIGWSVGTPQHLLQVMLSEFYIFPLVATSLGFTDLTSH